MHIEPQENGLTVRFRCDGMLRVQPVPPEINQFYAAIVTRLKIMSRLNIAEKRLPQDGRIKIRVSGREIDVRVSRSSPCSTAKASCCGCSTRSG